MSCNGSWKNSARNINYVNNELHCELADSGGKWIRNCLTFLPHLEYHNENGRFEWHNCKNEVEFGNNSYEHVSRRYKKITIAQCLEKLNTEYDDWFVIEKEYIQSKKRKVVFQYLCSKKMPIMRLKMNIQLMTIPGTANIIIFSYPTWINLPEPICVSIYTWRMT